MRIKMHNNMAHPRLGAHSADAIIDIAIEDAIPILAGDFAEALDPLPEEIRQRIAGAAQERQREKAELESAMKDQKEREDALLHRAAQGRSAR